MQDQDGLMDVLGGDIMTEVRDFYMGRYTYPAWARGANENMNGLVRQYIPKNRDLLSVTDEELLLIMNKLNHRPRKCLDFKTPFEVFFEQSVALQC